MKFSAILRRPASALMALLMLAAMLFPALAGAEASVPLSWSEYKAAGGIGDEENYETVAGAIEQVVNQAVALYEAGDKETARQYASAANSNYYKPSGFDSKVRTQMSGSDASHAQSLFTNLRKAIKNDLGNEAVRAAAELDALSRKGRKGPGPVFQIPAKGVVQRESTKFLPPAAALVRRASEFIKSRACEGIVPGDVYRHLRVSRSLAELRFAELRGETIRAAIERERLDRVKKLLKTTTRPLSRIAKEAGFKSATHLSHLFKKRTNLSPSAWRKGRGNSTVS